jgi:hypothetical protein
MKPTDPEPVKLIHGILYSNEQLLCKAKKRLIELFGKIDYSSPTFPFNLTGYYKEEMGSSIHRIFISHESLIHPKQLAEIKIITNHIEDELAIESNRNVNIDAGYMDVCKVVLASGKYNGQKIYLDLGIYADLTLYYEKGKFFHYPWSFPDFRSGEYNRAFLMIRERYKVQHKQWFREKQVTLEEE